MILNGFRLLVHLKKSWPVLVDGRKRSAASLTVAALTAAVFPSVAVVAGHLGSAMLGKEDSTTAALRAAVGFAATAGGALVTAPALTLLLIFLAESNRGFSGAERAGSVAVGVLRPVWTAGLVLGIPPLLGLGPEIGEILWAVLAFFIAHRIFRSFALSSLEIRRRWAGRFSLHASALFAILFIAVALGPAMTVRSMLGAATVIPVSVPETDALPLPPSPDW